MADLQQRQGVAQRQREGATGYETTFTPASGEPFRVSFVPGGIEVSGRLTSLERADEMIAAIKALRLLLKPAGVAVKPEWADKTFTAGEHAPASGVYESHHEGHIGGGDIEMTKGDPFPHCNECVGGSVRYEFR
jgi:hypothetical protein